MFSSLANIACALHVVGDHSINPHLTRQSLIAREDIENIFLNAQPVKHECLLQCDRMSIRSTYVIIKVVTHEEL